MLVEEILRPVFDKNQMTSTGDLLEVLDSTSVKSRTAKLWINCLIIPVFTILQYVRAEKEADWPLHLTAVKKMIPLFFAAGHTNYARYALYYLHSMEEMPEDIRQHFMKGEHTMHHKDSLFNGIWSDMAIETTYMRYGHGQKGIIGITLKPETLKTWAYSLHACNKIVNSLDTMRNQEEQPLKMHHKEEMKARMTSDAPDRKSLREKLEVCIDPLHENEHPDALVNIVTGKIVSHPSVNVDNAVVIGKKQMESFEESLPAGFHKAIQSKVHTMAVSRKHIKISENKVFDTEIIYARAMGLQRSFRNFDSRNLLAHELSPQPPSMFSEGCMREAKTKANLKNTLKVEVKVRTLIDINHTVDQNKDVMENLLAAHGVTGCDTVATYFGIGKGLALKVLRSKVHSLNHVGNISSSLEDAIHQSKHFILSCYGHSDCKTLTEARQTIWSKKVSRSICSAPKLQSLPPTDEAFRENAARAHLQVAIWKHAIDPHPPQLDPLNHGWMKDTCSDSLIPKTVAQDVSLAPADILKMIRCACESDIPCKTKHCGCHSANMACTVFCSCKGGSGCFNEKTKECLEKEEDEDEDEDVDYNDNSI